MGITVNTSPQQITASVGETQIDVAVSGGFGPSGNAGAPGQAASVTVGTVTTGAAGSQASVTNVGTSNAAVLNFTIPAGATGATGPQGPAGAAGASAWADITGKPTFAAVATSGAYSDLTGTPAAYSLPTATGSVLGGVKIGSGVTITDGVISVSTNYAAASHTHSALADITGLATVATSGAYADLTGRPTLGTAAAAATTDFAAASHTQAWTTITGTPTTLAGYGITDAAAASHTHALSSLTQSGATTGQVAQWDGAAWVPATAGGSSVAVRSDTVGSTSYIGRAAAGSATSASVWNIRRTILTSAGAVSSTATATNVKWDDRLTATYS